MNGLVPWFPSFSNLWPHDHGRLVQWAPTTMSDLCSGPHDHGRLVQWPPRVDMIDDSINDQNFSVSLRHVFLGSGAVVASWPGLDERLHDVRPNKNLELERPWSVTP